MNETFPHYYKDGYFATGGWKEIFYAGIYRDTHGMPYQWNKFKKKSKPVSKFIVSQFRGEKVDAKKCWYGCELIYGYSAN